MITAEQGFSTLDWHTKFEAGTQTIIGRGAIQRLPDALSGISAGKNVLMLTQNEFFNNEVERLSTQLQSEERSIQTLRLPDGENCKSTEQLTKIWDLLHKLKFTRGDCLVSIGGGSLSDIAGFAASTYLRGINLISVPTTLLAQVDAAIGGKTAVNLRHGKNLAGTFYFAKAVLIDIDTLVSLPDRQFKSGLAEVIKYSLLEKTIALETSYTPGSKTLLEVLKDTAGKLTWDHPALPEIITSCIKMKLAVVAKDPLESNLRRCLNLGHTLGHALESASNFSLSHGEAVAIGMAFALRFAVALNRLSTDNEAVALSLIKAAGLPVSIPSALSFDDIAQALHHDKKREGEGLKLVLPVDTLGEVSFNQMIEAKDIEVALRDFYQQQ